MSEPLYSVGTWNTDLQRFSPQRGLPVPSFNITLHQLRQAVRNLTGCTIPSNGFVTLTIRITRHGGTMRPLEKTRCRARVDAVVIVRLSRLVEAWYCRKIWTRQEWKEWFCDFVRGR